MRVTADPETIVIAGSRRSIRYYSGINFYEFGGSLFVLPETRKSFEEFVEKIPVPVLIEIDNWEVTQPDWIYSGNIVEYFKQFGFCMEKIVSRFTKNGFKEVIWIFYRGEKKDVQL